MPALRALAEARQWAALLDAASAALVPAERTGSEEPTESARHRVRYYRGLARYHLGDSAGALADADDAAGSDPRDARALSLRAVALLAEGRWDDALATARLAVAADPDDGPTRAEAAAVAAAVGEEDVATGWCADPEARPVLVVGSHRPSTQQERDGWLAAHEAAQRAEDHRRPSRINRLQLRPVEGADPRDTIGGLEIRGRREVPDARASQVGLVVLAVVVVALLAWMCSAPPVTDGPSSCVPSTGLDLRGNPVDVRC